MAKRGGGSNSLKVALVLDLDKFQAGLATAKATGAADGGTIATALSDGAEKATAAYFNAARLRALAERGLKAFVREAEALEKKGEGNEGTAAVSALAAKANELWEGFVKGVAGSRSFGVVLKVLEGGLWLVHEAMAPVGEFLEKLIMSTLEFVPTLYRGLGEGLMAIGRFLDDVGEAIESWGAETIGRAIRGAASGLTTAGMLQHQMGGVVAGGLASIKGGSEFSGQFGVDELEHPEQFVKFAKQPGFLASVASTVGLFENSWTAGLERLGQKFQTFNDKTGKNFAGMTEALGGSIGDLLEGFSAAGSAAQRAFGGAGAAARTFERIQLGVVGVLSIAKGAESLADGMSLGAEGKFIAAAAKFAASAAYATAAGLAGYAAAQVGRGAGAGIASQPIAQADNFSRERRNITVVIQNAVGSEDFVRNEVIPEINRAVGEDVFVVSSHAGSADRTDPGRF